MKCDIVTLFPDTFTGFLGESIIKIAQKKRKVRIAVRNIRDWARDRHRTADDKPYGGGSGMVMKIEPLFGALVSVLGKNAVKRVREKRAPKGTRVIVLTPRGRRFDQGMARQISKAKHLVLICGHYEGIDERVHAYATDEVSVGDYILTGGEVAAMIVLDAVIRLIPGVLGDQKSLHQESFENNLLEYPQYTRPRAFESMEVPGVLLSGDHRAIERWRRRESLKKTQEARSDLLTKRRV
jgi:tRNA (guanine37-N1)-methyltransferase